MTQISDIVSVSVNKIHCCCLISISTLKRLNFKIKEYIFFFSFKYNTPSSLLSELDTRRPFFLTFYFKINRSHVSFVFVSLIWLTILIKCLHHIFLDVIKGELKSLLLYKSCKTSRRRMWNLQRTVKYLLICE